MEKIDFYIVTIDEVICTNIEKFDPSYRGILSQNILAQLRNFVEIISLKVYSNGQDIEINYDKFKDAIKFIKSRGSFKFLSKFHNLLQKSVSHYTLDEENSERLMLKYYEYLLRIKSFLKSEYNLDVLENIAKFPIKTDSHMMEYYKKIAFKINHKKIQKSENRNRYYIQKTKPYFVDNEVYYEVTFTPANDYASKFDRIIAFTKYDISENYAVKLSIISESIEIMGKNMPIQIINDWEVSIRPCEFRNLGKIFGFDFNISSSNHEYIRLMNLLTTGINLVDLIVLDDDFYQKIKSHIIQGQRKIHIFGLLDKCRDLIKNGKQGSNVVKYLLYKMNNKVINKQFRFRHGGLRLLSNLHLEYGCIPFDEMPFASSLINHNPKLSDLFECIDPSNREHEILAKIIKNNTEMKGQLYTPEDEIKGFDNIDELREIYNNNLYYRHYQMRKIERYDKYIYTQGYETDTHEITVKLKELTQSGIGNYSSSAKSWLEEFPGRIDCAEKKDALIRMFENSTVALIYGSAGTGKSTLIKHVSDFFNNYGKLYLANTNPAIDNLRRKVTAANCNFSTIAKFLSRSNRNTEFDLLFIDECSTVSNSDMVAILNKASFKLLVLVGDIYQIESILFGNWFNMARSFIPKTSVFELTKPYRSNNTHLLNLWSKVRNIGDDILEHLTRNNYSTIIDNSVFERSEEDEIILCLNYDGFYGINNFNKLLQNTNDNEAVQWGIQTYKINDPVLFNETERFAPLIYNNLKGRIVGIEKFADRIKFDIEIDKAINELDARGYDFHLLRSSSDKKSVISFSVNKYDNTDDDDDDSSHKVIPFQVSYAVSIHKAQGLEYESVKVVITDEIEEKVTHNIFYTAITRAKEKLKIYWTPETEHNILTNLKKRNINRDVRLFTSKLRI